MGCTSAIVFTCFGAAYGTAKAGVGISAMGVLRPDLIVKSMAPSAAAATAAISPVVWMPRLRRWIKELGQLTRAQTLSPSLWLVSLVSTVWSFPS